MDGEGEAGDAEQRILLQNFEQLPRISCALFVRALRIYLIAKEESLNIPL